MYAKDVIAKVEITIDGSEASLKSGSIFKATEFALLYKDIKAFRMITYRKGQWIEFDLMGYDVDNAGREYSVKHGCLLIDKRMFDNYKTRGILPQCLTI